MNSPRLRPACVAACVLGLTGVSHAQMDDPTLPRNRLSLGTRFAFSYSATVNNLPQTPTARPDYDDGFVRPDLSGGAGGQTWYWGYDAANQIVGGNLELHNAPSPRDGSSETFGEDPQAGFEILYGREFFGWTLAGDRHLALGLEGGFTSTGLDLRTSSTLTGPVARTADTYSLAGIAVPGAPYAGTFAGPGPLINAAPIATRTDVGVPITSSQTLKLDGMVYGLKFGPFLEIPIVRRLKAVVGAGVAFVNAEADLEASESFTFAAPGSPPPARSSRESGSDFVFGFYGQATLAFDLTESIALYGGVQFQDLGELKLQGATKQATLDLGASMALVGGLRFTF